MPPAPFGVLGGQGDRPRREDVRLAGLAIRQRYPISDELRASMIGWLAKIAEHGEEERVRVAAVKSLLDADKMNAREAELAAARAEDPKPQEININVAGGIDHRHAGVFGRIAELQRILAERPGSGVIAGDHLREPMDSGPDQIRTDAAAG